MDHSVKNIFVPELHNAFKCVSAYFIEVTKELELLGQLIVFDKTLEDFLNKNKNYYREALTQIMASLCKSPD